MDTLQTQCSKRNTTTKGLFQELFLTQFRLEKYQQQGFDHSKELSEIVEKIDQLMETLIKSFDQLTE